MNLVDPFAIMYWRKVDSMLCLRNKCVPSQKLLSHWWLIARSFLVFGTEFTGHSLPEWEWPVSCDCCEVLITIWSDYQRGLLVFRDQFPVRINREKRPVTGEPRDRGSHFDGTFIWHESSLNLLKICSILHVEVVPVIQSTSKKKTYFGLCPTRTNLIWMCEHRQTWWPHNHHHSAPLCCQLLHLPLPQWLQTRCVSVGVIFWWPFPSIPQWPPLVLSSFVFFSMVSDLGLHHFQDSASALMFFDEALFWNNRNHQSPTDKQNDRPASHNHWCHNVVMTQTQPKQS